jgi:hypothetical protein
VELGINALSSEREQIKTKFLLTSNPYVIEQQR